MNKLIGLLVALFMFGMVSTPNASIMGFDDLSFDGEGSRSITNYQGFTFSADAWVSETDEGYGYTHTVVSPHNVLFNAYTNDISFGKTETFTLNDAYFTTPESSTVYVTVLGLLGGILSQNMVFDVTRTPTLITFDWENIDTVAIHTQNSTGYTRMVAIDDIRYDEPIGGTAPVPVPATMLLFGTGLIGIAVSRFRKKK